MRESRLRIYTPLFLLPSEFNLLGYLSYITLQGAMLYRRGVVADTQCRYCARGNGRYPQCVHWPPSTAPDESFPTDFFNGACCNCLQSGASRCTDGKSSCQRCCEHVLMLVGLGAVMRSNPTMPRRSRPARTNRATTSREKSWHGSSYETTRFLLSLRDNHCQDYLRQRAHFASGLWGQQKHKEGLMDVISLTSRITATRTGNEKPGQLSETGGIEEYIDGRSSFREWRRRDANLKNEL